MSNEKGLTAKKEEDVAKWYEEVCLKSELAEFSSVKGTTIIRPRGYFIWQAIQNYFDKNIVEKTNCENAYFPLFIPESFFKRESKHAKGFTPEVAWIDKELTKDGERLAIRPTSETIIYDSYSKWIRSYKDLPLRINQWCNVVRWETEATKLFLRSREFLWQEGHCVYETEKECAEETLQYIKLYKKLCEDLLCLPVLIGMKTEKEKFAGAKDTFTIEAFMPDGKALQCGTSHNLGQGFAKAFDISYLGKDEKKHFPWQNSWGISTRLIGATVMTHSDNKGLVLPPEVAKNKIVIIPILFAKDKDKILKEAQKINKELKKFNPILDNRDDYSPGWKYSEWELKGVPLRIEIGPRDLEKKSVTIVKRNTSEKIQVKIKDLKNKIPKLLDEIKKELFESAKKFLESKIVQPDDWKEFEKSIKDRKISKSFWCGDVKCEEAIREKTGATSRCISFDFGKSSGKCIHCGKLSKTKIYFARSY